MSGSKHNENPFMRTALTPIDALELGPDLRRPISKNAIYIATKHKEDMLKEGSTAVKASFALEATNHLVGMAQRGFQTNETEAAELELATPTSHRTHVENYNSALAVATGNGTIAIVQSAMAAMKGVADQVHDSKDEPVTLVEQQLTFGERVRGKVMMPSKE